MRSRRLVTCAAIVMTLVALRGTTFADEYGPKVKGPAWADSSASKPMKAAVLTVHIKDYTFAPNVGNAHVGDTVTFVNDDGETHTATANDGAFDSHGLAEKGRFSHTFTKPGTYNYHCTIHTQMAGTIVVTMPKKGNAR